jgi:flavin prenyltransferase
MGERQIVVAVTGASGAIYAGRLLRALLINGHTVHLVLSKYGRYLLTEELGFDPGNETIPTFLQRLYGDAVLTGTLHEYGFSDLTCALASGSSQIHGMAVVPCSMKSLAGIAMGLSDNLIERAADVALKERRPLVLVPRETPLNLIHLRNMTAVAEAGASLVPAMPAFYQRPANFDELADFIAGRVLDLLGVDNELFTRWSGQTKQPGCGDLPEEEETAGPAV